MSYNPIDLQTTDDFIMEACTPRKMSPADAVDFLEDVIERCRSAIEALKEENDFE